MPSFKSKDIIEVIITDRDTDVKWFRGKADLNNLRQMKLLADMLRDKGVIFPE